VLPRAATTDTEVRAGGSDSVRRRRDHLEQASADESAVILGDLDVDDVAWTAARDEGGATVGQMAYGVSTVGQAFDMNLDHEQLLEGMR
jgi:hypothetical protein